MLRCLFFRWYGWMDGLVGGQRLAGVCWASLCVSVRVLIVDLIGQFVVGVIATLLS